MIWCKQHNSPKGLILAISDENLLGKTFEEGEFCLSITNFYKGELLAKNAVTPLLDEAVMINAVGEKAVEVILAAGLGSADFVKKVDGIPHLQVLKITS